MLEEDKSTTLVRAKCPECGNRDSQGRARCARLQIGCLGTGFVHHRVPLLTQETVKDETGSQ
jgi:hypothetical protein